MRRLVVIVLAFSAFAGTAAAGLVTADSDGTLSVRNADGTILIKADGAVVGRFDQGYIRVFDPVDGDPLDVTVWGAERTRAINDTMTLYSGENVRFRIIGRFRIRSVGFGISLSAVGQGRVGLEGDVGTYSVNGKPRKPMPSDPDGLLTYIDLADAPGPGNGGP